MPTASDIAASLRASGWKASAVSGMPHTVTGFPQIAYLATTSPSGTQIDLQFFATGPQATAEAKAAEKRFHGFHAVAIGDLIAFSHAIGQRELPASDLTAIRAAATR